MENNFKKAYYNKANDLFARLMDEADAPEAPEADEETPAEGEPEETTDAPETDAEQTEEQAKPIEVFFANLDKDTRKSLMDVLKSSLNATKDDEVAESKIKEALSKKPLISLLSDEIVRKLGIKI